MEGSGPNPKPSTLIICDGSTWAREAEVELERAIPDAQLADLISKGSMWLYSSIRFRVQGLGFRVGILAYSIYLGSSNSVGIPLGPCIYYIATWTPWIA